MGTGVLSGVRTAAAHSPPPTAEVKNEWIYTCTSPISLHDVDRYNINFNLCVGTLCTFLMISHYYFLHWQLLHSIYSNNSDFL